MSEIPKLNSIVYVVYYDDGKPLSVDKTTVFMKNQTGFCTPMSFDYDLVPEARTPLLYEEKGIRWFKTLKEVRAFLKDNYPSRILKKQWDSYWEVRYRCV